MVLVKQREIGFEKMQKVSGIGVQGSDCLYNIGYVVYLSFPYQKKYHI